MTILDLVGYILAMLGLYVGLMLLCAVLVGLGKALLDGQDC